MNKHQVVVDLGYGDAGKGTTVDYLCSLEPKRAVIRFNGGSQAAHNVVAPDGRHHTFAQFGSGMFHDGVRTHLSNYMLVNPIALEIEAMRLRDLGVPNVWERLTVDEYAPVTTPFHVAVNRAKENARGDSRHGSCGQGIGETQAFANQFPAETLRVMDLRSWHHLVEKLHFLVSYYNNEGYAFRGETVREVAIKLWESAENMRIVSRWETSYLLNEGPCVFEGAQGVLLDEYRGFHPYTTWSTTTFANAESLAQEGNVLGNLERIGVMRSYMTRHGAGPFVTEDDDLFTEFHEPHNTYGEYQGGWRVGHLDFVALRYALKVVGGVDSLYVTHLDQSEESEQLRYCGEYVSEKTGQAVTNLTPPRYRDLDAQARLTERLMNDYLPELESFNGDVLGTIERELDTEVSVVSYGPTRADKRPVHRVTSGVL